MWFGAVHLDALVAPVVVLRSSYEDRVLWQLPALGNLLLVDPQKLPSPDALQQQRRERRTQNVPEEVITVPLSSVEPVSVYVCV